MKNKYKVTYRSATGNMSYCDSYDMFELALKRYNEVIANFDTWADVKLTVETILMQRA